MKLFQTADYDSMSRKAADFIAAQIILKPDCVLGLATGSTPIGTYQNLIDLYISDHLDFSRVKTVNLDEYRGLSGDDVNSYHYYMKENLFQFININPDNTYIPDGTDPEPEEMCARYDRIISRLGGIDLQILGIGRNGHIGFNEPGDVFHVNTHCVDLARRTIRDNRRFFPCEADVPRQAYTMGMGAIMNAKKILLLASGKEKAPALHKAFCQPVSPRVPASILQLHPDVTVIADFKACEELAPFLKN